MNNPLEYCCSPRLGRTVQIGTRRTALFSSLFALIALGNVLSAPTQAAPTQGTLTPPPVMNIPPVEKPTPLGDYRAQLVETTSFIRAGQARASHNVDGSGLTIAVLDTGINMTHTDFTGSIVLTRNYTTADGGDINNVTDRQGHGTNVASLAMAHGPDTGIAPGAKVAVFKVLGDTGSGSTTWSNNALQWLVDNAEANNISVVNMSLGDGGNYTDDAATNATERSLISQLRAKNIAVVVAAGNNYGGVNAQGMGSPAIDRDTVSVGAVYDANIGAVGYSNATAFSTAAGRITPFSQRLHPTFGTAACRTDIFAPGAALTGAGITGDNSSSTMHGTSQATPVLAGVILLMQQQYKSINGTLPPVDFIENWLRTSAVTINDGDDEDDSVTNTGLDFPRVDALNALDAISSGNPLVSITSTSVTETSGGVTAHLTVSLSVPATSAATVDWATQDGTAAAGNDYVAATGTLNFAVGDQSKTIDIGVNDDQFVESAETFGVKLTGASGAGIVDSAATGSVTINDNDSITLTSPGNYSILSNGLYSIYGTTSSTGVTAMKYFRRPALGQFASSSAIPQGSTLTSVQNFSSSAPMVKVFIYINFTHPVTSQLSISLKTNTGSNLALPSANNNTVYTLTLPAATTTVNGDWTLSIADNTVDSNQGTLNSWGVFAVPQTGTETLINTASSADINGNWNTTWDTATTPNGIYRATMRSFNGATALGEDSHDFVQVNKPLSAPTDISLSNSSVAESLPSGTTVGSFSTTDATPGDVFTYSLVAGTVANDNASFSIAGNVLKTKAIFDYETKNSYSIRVRTTDVDGLFFEKDLNIAVSDVIEDSQAPAVVISTPTANQPVLLSSFNSTTVKGTASDNVGVTSVAIKFYRTRNGANEFWNGTSFGPTSSTVPATLSGTATSRTWKWDTQLPTVSQLDIGAYNLWAYATDAAGHTTNARVAFTLEGPDSQKPVIKMAAPIANQKVLISNFLSGFVNGTATDNIGVTLVRVKLYRKRGTVNEFWNGSVFTTTSTFVNAALSGSSWSLTNLPAAGQLDSGLYQVAAYATDAAGNTGSTSVITFTLTNDLTVPTVSISTPVANQKIDINAFGPGTISGAAGDNIGVASVKLKLYRKRGTTNQFWNGTAFTPTSALVDATVSTAGNQSVTWSLSSQVPDTTTLDAGVYTLYAYAYDAAGNSKASTSRSFSVTGIVSGAATISTSSSSAGGS